MECPVSSVLSLGFILLCCVQSLHAQSLMPDYIKACYENSSNLLKDRGLPLNMMTLLELIHKVEMNPRAALDLRTMAYTLLHKLKIDGIERDPRVSESPGLIPYTLQGSQYTKFSILLGKLLPGHSNFFPEDSLNDVEMCALHAMLSNRVDRWQRGDEDSTCPHNLNSRGRRQANLESRCPTEGGVIHTNWGTVSPGHVIGAIAAALELQQVRVGRLVELPAVKERAQPQPEAAGRLMSEDVELLENYQPPAKEMRLGRLEDLLVEEQRNYYQKLQELPETEAVTNTWAATIAGDLSEVAIYQAPYTVKLEVGLSGRWNDTTIPRALYLNEQGSWDMTAGEINGGLDGLIVASKVALWIRELSRLRLSQVLDMYYSGRGISFDPSYRACTRASKARQVLDSERLLNETTNFARVLFYNSMNSVQLLNVESFSRRAVSTFLQQLDSILSTVTCTESAKTVLPPRVNLHVILDTTWWGYEAVRLLGALAEGVLVSRYSSSMGVLSGRESLTGRLANNTNSYSDFMQELGYITTWPRDLDLPLSLSTLLGELTRGTKEDLERGFVGGASHVVLVLGYSATISDEDLSSTKQMIDMFRRQQRDVHFLYAASSRNQNRYQSLIRTDSFNVDSVIVLNDTIHTSVVSAVVEKLRQVPWRIISSLCEDTNSSSTLPGEMEDYVTPGQQNTYRIHPDYLQGVSKMTLKFRGSGYGVLSVCWSRQQPVSSSPNSCVEVSGHEESLVNLDSPCGGGGTCRPLYVSVNVTTSYNKCAEDDCRFPDQVRFSLSQEGLRCSTGGGTTLPVSSISSTRDLCAWWIIVTLLLIQMARH